MSAFAKYHPVVNFIFFAYMLCSTVFIMNPIFLFIGFVCSFTYNVILKGKKAFFLLLKFALPVFFLTVVINPIFSHEGITTLFYLPSGNPYTLESLIYSIGAGLLMMNAIEWASCLNEVMTSDKFVYLFGRVAPALSLVLSMTIRFVPKFISEIKDISASQKLIYKDDLDKGLFGKLKFGIRVLSTEISGAMENSVECATSLKNRGYGIKKRSFYSNYVFEKRDFVCLVIIVACGTFCIYSRFAGLIDYRYYPSFRLCSVTPIGLISYISYFVVAFMPVFITERERIKWNFLRQKI